jgi:hypothetical protein
MPFRSKYLITLNEGKHYLLPAALVLISNFIDQFYFQAWTLV